MLLAVNDFCIPQQLNRWVQLKLSCGIHIDYIRIATQTQNWQINGFAFIDQDEFCLVTGKFAHAIVAAGNTCGRRW
jgi:hypothetical protein